MKKIIFALTIIATLASVSCKKKAETKEAVEKEVAAPKGYKVSAQGSIVEWTGYKFTEKKGVKGKFKLINVINAPLAQTPIAAFNGVDFSIPVSSIFSDNAIRDGKLMKLFFGFMDNTELLTGNFVTKGEQIVLNLKMNNVTKEIPLTHTVSDRHVKLEGSLNILDFGAEKAFNSIHKACEVLHTGADKVSKTWEDVKIEAIVFLKES
ncbi:YceI family protein [Aquimarina agarilytica]|uniref:YceI family protein n=1 Tax=Aquimarina agarilytica TaxID=1087449 RepID=UPI00028A0DE1|nr:YceI family protein [Aquimarina agarilytica]